VGPGEEVRPGLSQALTRGARPDSNSRPAVQTQTLCHHATPLGDNNNSNNEFAKCICQLIKCYYYENIVWESGTNCVFKKF
jgi:hypothetical protein